MIVHRVDNGIVRAMEVPQLKIIGRIGENQIDRSLGQVVHQLDTIAGQNLIDGKVGVARGWTFLMAGPS